MSDERLERALYVVGTPIGNLEDITLRALRVLRSADRIACEDTRQTQKLLNHYEIHTPTVSYHEHNEMTRAPELVVHLEEGESIALVTDAGMPGISDPGFRLISLAVRHGERYLPVKECAAAEKLKPKAPPAKSAPRRAGAKRRGSDWNKNFDLNRGPKVGQAAERSGCRPQEAAG